MIILILLLTFTSDIPNKDVWEEAEHSKAWTVSTSEDAACMVMHYQKRADKEGLKLEARLYAVDVKAMKVEEKKIPNVLLGKIKPNEINAVPVEDGSVLLEAFNQ